MMALIFVKTLWPYLPKLLSSVLFPRPVGNYMSDTVKLNYLKHIYFITLPKLLHISHFRRHTCTGFCNISCLFLLFCDHKQLCTSLTIKLGSVLFNVLPGSIHKSYYVPTILENFEITQFLIS